MKMEQTKPHAKKALAFLAIVVSLFAGLQAATARARRKRSNSRSMQRIRSPTR